MEDVLLLYRPFELSFAQRISFVLHDLSLQEGIGLFHRRLTLSDKKPTPMASASRRGRSYPPSALRHCCTACPQAASAAASNDTSPAASTSSSNTPLDSHRSIIAARWGILPGIVQVTAGKMAQATGLSRPYCSMMRHGADVPHPRHWPALERLAQGHRQ